MPTPPQSTTGTSRNRTSRGEPPASGSAQGTPSRSRRPAPSRVSSCLSLNPNLIVARYELHDGRWLRIASAKDDQPVNILLFDAIVFSLGDLWP